MEQIICEKQKIKLLWILPALAPINQSEEAGLSAVNQACVSKNGISLKFMCGKTDKRVIFDNIVYMCKINNFKNPVINSVPDIWDPTTSHAASSAAVTERGGEGERWGLSVETAVNCPHLDRDI